MTITYKSIDEKAAKLLHQSNALALPVDLNQVIGYLGLSLDETPLENEYSGFLAIKERIIVVNLRHPPTRRRFTIAHEIGHYQLHRRRSEDIPVFIDRAVYHRKDSAAGVDHLMEMQANAYAAGLLMPEALLDKYLEDHPLLDLEKPADIKILAEEFEVSRPAMEFRLKNLGFVLRTSF